MKRWITGLRVASIFLYLLCVGAALFSFELRFEGNDPAPWLDPIWIGSGVLSLLLAFHVEKIEQNRRMAANGEAEKPG